MAVDKHTNILIVDDDYVITLHLENLLVENGYNVVGIAASAEEAISLVKKSGPDVIFMDIKIKGKLDGIDAAEKILKQFGVSSIFLSGYDDYALIERAKRVNPLAFLLKPINERQILVELEVALFKLNEQKEHLLFTNDVFPDELPPRYGDLTPTEIRVAPLVRKGKRTKEIAEDLDVSPQTVMWHRKNIRKKLHLSNTKENLTTSLLK